MSKRSFILGDQWLYYKWYCGKRVADRLITELLPRVMQALKEKAEVDHWFFIRYGDPESHLRVRFHLKDIEKIGKALLIVRSELRPYLDQGFIWKVQTDTYHRELERYGTNTMESMERVFHSDSTFCVSALSLIVDDSLLLLYGIRSIDHCLSNFGCDLATKTAFVKSNQQAFRNEFKVDAALSKKVNRRYQQIRRSLAEFMGEVNPAHEQLYGLFRKKALQMKPMAEGVLRLKDQGLLEMRLEDLLGSVIHMMINRLFRDRQRVYEWLCYDFLMRYYLGEQGRVESLVKNKFWRYD